MKTTIVVLLFASSFVQLAYAADTAASRAAFRAIYEEMVEIDSSPTTGSCTKVVEAARARLRSAW